MMRLSRLSTGKKTPAVMYSNILLSIAPVSHCSEVPFTNPPQEDETCEESGSSKNEVNFNDLSKF